MTAEEQPDPVHDGPDPREWPACAPQLWNLVLDIEHLNRLQATLAGPVPPEVAPAYAEARGFLDAAGAGLRANLIAALMSVYRLGQPGAVASEPGHPQESPQPVTGRGSPAGPPA